jgi:hypothetical protein
VFECHVIGTVALHDVLGRIDVRNRLAYDDQGAGVHAFIIGKICTEKYVIMLLKKPKYARKIQNMHHKIIV